MKKVISIVLLSGISLHAVAFSDTDTMLKASEKKWSIYSGINWYYRFPYKPLIYYFPTVFSISPGCDVLISRQIHKWGFLTSGVEWMHYASVAKWTSTDGTENKKSMTNHSLGVPFIYSIHLFPNSKVYPIFRGGFVATTLLSSVTIGGNGLYTHKNEYRSGSKAIFFLGSLQLNIHIKNNLFAVASIDYLQQNKSYIKTSVDTVFDLAKIIRIGTGIKLSF